MGSNPDEPDRQHWEQVYATRSDQDVGWFQAEPVTSVRLVETYAPDRAAPVVDIGGGAARLVDRLLDEGYRDVTVLDLARPALDQVRERLGARASDVDLVQADVTTWATERTFGVWHDRAVFHFVCEPDAQARYVSTATHVVAPGGVLLLGTFAPDGPEYCSGLPVCRYGPDDVAAIFASGFALEHHEREIHVTPAGVEQAYSWVVMRRV